MMSPEFGMSPSELAYSGSELDIFALLRPRFDATIAEEVAKIKTLVEAIDRRRDNCGFTVLTFGYDELPQDYVMHYQTMIRAFDLYGVVDAYYAPERFPYTATYTEYPHGWDKLLLTQSRDGEFLVSFRHKTEHTSPFKRVNHQTVTYKHR